jgi:peptidoglycan LD-endopeptidase LytH
MTQGFRARFVELLDNRRLQVATIAAMVVAGAAAAAPIAASPDQVTRQTLLSTAVERAVEAVETPPAPTPMQLVWQGVDIDDDGKADFANPTGGEQRGHDAYGDGEFGASRDGGSRNHEGVDFVARAGQDVTAPISGYVTKIGYAYAGDSSLKYVEITNPALHYQARVFYVTPKVSVGDTVAVGDTIATAHSLQKKYPGGMTDHVHLEISDNSGRRFDAHKVLTAQYVPANPVTSTQVALAD